MSDFTLIASLVLFAATSLFAHTRYDASLGTSNLLGLVSAAYLGGILNPAFFASTQSIEAFSLMLLVVPVIAESFVQKGDFIENNTVLLNRTGFAGMSLTPVTAVDTKGQKTLCKAA